MTPAAPILTALLLMLALGLRHGLDPEHIALVNAVTLRRAAAGRRHPALGGLYFALGHGLVITAVALGLTQLLGFERWPDWLVGLARWLPTVILFLVASVNLRDLLRQPQGYQPGAVKVRLLPSPLRDSTHPLAIFVIGMLFAPFVDPATQTAVWGYVVGTASDSARVALMGAVLTAAMAATCVVEARAMIQLTRLPDARRAERRQRLLGWGIVVLSYAIVLYTLGSALWPDVGGGVLLLDVLLLLLVLAASLAAGLTLRLRQRRRQSGAA